MLLCLKITSSIESITVFEKKMIFQVLTFTMHCLNKIVLCYQKELLCVHTAHVH